MHTPDTTKISISVQPDLLANFKERLGPVIKRDALINQLIAQEVPYLRAELHGLRNSPASRAHIARELRKLKPTTINVVVEKRVAAELNEVVKEANLVRDSVLNFLLYCLDPPRDFYNEFNIPAHPGGLEVNFQPPSVNAMANIAAILADPLQYLRAAVAEVHRCGLYALEMPADLHGIACYLPDDFSPTAYESKRRELREQQDEVTFLLG